MRRRRGVDGTKHKLVLFPETAVTRATWDNLAELVLAEYGPEVHAAILPHLPAIKVTQYAAIDVTGRSGAPRLVGASTVARALRRLPARRPPRPAPGPARAFAPRTRSLVERQRSMYAGAMVAAATAEAFLPEPMTLEQWADLDEDEPGELVDSLLVEEEVPTHLHEIVVAWLIESLRRWARPRGGWVFGSEHKLAVSATRGRKPDVTLYGQGAPLRRRDSISRTAPELVVEVVSPRPRDVRRDRLEKLNEYSQLGVRSYWLIDPEARLVEMCVLGPDGLYVHARSVTTGKVQPPELEGLELDLDDLWAEVSRMPDDGDE